MTGRLRTWTCAFAPLALAALVAALLALRPAHVQTSLYDLAGDAAASVPAAVRNRANNRVSVVVSAKSFDAACAAADAFVAALPTNRFASVRFRDDGAALADARAFYAACGAGVVSSEDAARLKTPEGRAKIARAAIRKHFTSPVALFAPAQDPFFLLGDFAASLPAAVMGWTLRDGVLSADADGTPHVLVSLTLKPEDAGDVDALEKVASAVHGALETARRGDAGARLAACGVPLHTAASATRCRGEIGWLGAFSLAFIVLLGFWAFRTWKFLGWFALSLGNAALAGFAALLVLSPSFHAIALVFGTTVLGLVIDYSFHWLLRAEDDPRATRRNLLVSWATTEAGLAPLACASLPALAQSAVFLGAGLAAALATVLVLYPMTRFAGVASPAVRRPVRGGILLAACSASALALLPFVRLDTPLAALYRPPADLAAAEARFARLSGVDATRGALVTTARGGETLDDLLVREARASGSADGARLSRFLPPLAARRAAWENVKALYAEQGENLRRALKLNALALPPAPEPWNAAALPRAVFGDFLVDGALVAPNVPAPALCGDRDGVLFWRPADLGRILSVWEREALVLFAVAASLTLLILFVFLRRRSVRVFASALFGFLAVVALLSARGESVNLFHVLAGFLLLGMGVDYAVFVQDSRGRAARSAVCALLTSMAGFGALAFVSFPVVAAFGFTLGVGLPASFLAAWLLAPGDAPSRRSETEHGASPLGLETAYVVYRVFGKRALDALAAAIGLCVWAFSPGARKASPSPGKTMRFARSLADKFAVACGGSGQPRVETDGSADAAAFLDDVRAKRGVFVLSSHCGTIEVLPALGACDVVFHAWMDVARTGVFNAFRARHAKGARVRIHPVESLGMESAFEAGDWLDAGDCAVMAADLESSATADGGARIVVSEGAVRFARALGHPVYFVACVRTRGSRYRTIVRKLPLDSRAALARAYESALAEVVGEHPGEWFRWCC